MALFRSECPFWSLISLEAVRLVSPSLWTEPGQQQGRRVQSFCPPHQSPESPQLEVWVRQGFPSDESLSSALSAVSQQSGISKRPRGSPEGDSAQRLLILSQDNLQLHSL